MLRRLSLLWVLYAIQLRRQSITLQLRARRSVLLRFVFTDHSLMRSLSLLFLRQLSRSSFSTEQRSLVLQQSHLLLMLCQQFVEQSSRILLSQEVVTDLVLRIQLLQRSLLHLIIQRRKSSHSASSMM